MKSSILLLENDPWLADVYQKVLDGNGCKVYLARDAYEGLEALEEHPDIQLGIVDIMLDGPSGISFLYEVVSQIDWQDKRFIVISHCAEREICSDGYLWQQLNVISYFYKPDLTLESLIGVVSREVS